MVFNSIYGEAVKGETSYPRFAWKVAVKLSCVEKFHLLILTIYSHKEHFHAHLCCALHDLS